MRKLCTQLGRTAIKLEHIAAQLREAGYTTEANGIRAAAQECGTVAERIEKASRRTE